MEIPVDAAERDHNTVPDDQNGRFRKSYIGGKSMKPALIYEFRGHLLDIGRRRLQHGGSDVMIRPKSLALLVYLMENFGRVIDKEELIGAIWPNSILGRFSQPIPKGCPSNPWL